MQNIFVFIFTFLVLIVVAQTPAPTWTTFTDSIPSLSSPRTCDLNNDGILDVVIGGGTDGAYSNNGIIAYNGASGAVLWKRGSRNEVFGSAVFQDITNDGIKDVFITGRQAQLLAINGANGQLIWDYFPYPNNPADSGLFNFYNPQIIHDVDNDGFNDLLVANGGDHSAPDWQIDRPPGHLMVVSGQSGALLAKAVVPDSAETYCSPIVVDVQNNGIKWILYGTGGENLGGSFWACPLQDLIVNHSLSNSIALSTDLTKGFIAPASAYKTSSGSYDFFILSYGGELKKINGSNWSAQWIYQLPNTESSAAPVLGNFVGGDVDPDVFVSLFKGIAPSYSDFYQVIIDGATGQEVFKDSLGTLGYASGNAVDLNNDGRDEAVTSITYWENGKYKNRIHAIDFQNQQISQIGETYVGVNLSCTPYVGSVDFDSELEMIVVTKKDSVNPVGWKGIYLRRLDLSAVYPNSGIAWGSYMGVNANGLYQYDLNNCGQGSVIINGVVTNPSCNNFSDGLIDPIVSGFAAPYTYLWSNGSVDTMLVNLPEGNYWVRVTNSFGCYEDRSVVLTDPYVISFGGILAPSCPGGSNGWATVGSSGCPCQFSGCTFLWDNGITTKPNQTLTSGWHSVVIHHPSGCIVEDSVLIPEPLPIIIDSVQVNNLCFNDALGGLDLINSNYSPVNYNWSNGETSQQIDSLENGVYSVVVSDARGCIDTLSFEITSPSQIYLNSTIQNITCFGSQDGSVFLSANGGVAPYLYYLNQSLVSDTVSNLAAGIYFIEVEDENECVVLFSDTISEPSQLVTQTSSTPEIDGFDGSASVIVSGGTPPFNFSWNDINNQNLAAATYLNTGWYTVTVSDANGCAIEDSVFVDLASGLISLASNDFNVFPNPFEDYILFSNPVSSISLFDHSGRLICRFYNVDQLDLSSLSPGLYHLCAYANETFKHVGIIKK